MAAPTFVALDRGSAMVALEGMARSRDPHAVDTYTRILCALAESPNGGRSIRLPLTNGIVQLLGTVHVRPGLVACVRRARYVATYQHPEDPTVPHVVVRSYERPKMRRTLDGPGGRRRYVRISLDKLKEDTNMAPRNTRTRAKSRAKAKPAEELDDLEALEELEELDDIEDDEPPAKAKGRARAKAKAKPVVEDDDDEDEDDDEEDVDDEDVDDEDEDDEDEDDDEEDVDDDEDEEPAPRKRRASRTSKAPARKSAKASASKSSKAPAKKTAKKSPVGQRGPRPVSSGKLSVTDVAEMAGTDGATLRQWLRRNGIEKDEDSGRYEFTKSAAAKIVKAYNK